MRGSAADALEERSDWTVMGPRDGDAPFAAEPELEDVAILGALGEAVKDISERYVGLRSRVGVLFTLFDIRLDEDGVEDDIEAAACRYVL